VRAFQEMAFRFNGFGGFVHRGNGVKSTLMFRPILLRVICGFVGLVFLFPTGVAAQSASISGTVIDISGAAIPPPISKGKPLTARRWRSSPMPAVDSLLKPR
jgi:hypothetical protein